MTEPHTRSPESQTKTPEGTLLKRYEKEVELYKFYLEISVKCSLFAFGITGALASYFFANHEQNRFLVWSLMLPVVLNGGFFVLFFSSILASTKMMNDHKMTCEGLNALEPFDMNPLPALCKILSCMYGLVTIGLLAAMVIYAI